MPGGVPGRGASGRADGGGGPEGQVAGWAAGLGRWEEAAGGPGQVPRGGGEGGRALGGRDTGRVRSWRFPVPDLFNFPSHSCPGSGGSGGSGSGSDSGPGPAVLTARAQTAGGSGSAEPRAPRPASGRSPAKTNGPSLFIAAAGARQLRAARQRTAAAPGSRSAPGSRRARTRSGTCAPHGEPRGGRRERRPSLAGPPEPPVPLRAAPGPPGAP